MSDQTSAGSKGPDRSSAIVLLIDDEPDILPEYEEFLELHGFKVLTQANPEEALRMVKERAEIGVVVTDLKMAKLNGVSLIDNLRACLPQSRRVQFIILTGDPSLLARSEVSDAPVLLKPVDVDALIGTIDSALMARQ